MNNSEYLFYEDTKNAKTMFFSFMVLFYIGAVVNTTFMIIALVVPQASLRNVDSITISLTSLCWIMAIFMTVAINMKSMNYSITITKNELIFQAKKKTQVFSVVNLLKYEVVYWHKRFAKYKVIFDKDIVLIITTRKPKELKEILDKLTVKSENGQ